jgi:hypothetical protein
MGERPKSRVNPNKNRNLKAKQGMLFLHRSPNEDHVQYGYSKT